MADCFYDNYHCGCDCLFFTCSSGKNAEMISQLWLEKQHIKTGNLCTNKTKEE